MWGHLLGEMAAMRYDATRKYHEFLGAVTSHAAEGILAFDGAGQVILSNPAVDKIFGYFPSKVEGENLATLLSEEDLDTDQWANIFRHLEEDGVPHSPAGFSGRAKDGSIVPIEIAVGKAVLTDGEVVYIANCRDITSRLKVESKLRKQAEIIAQMQDGLLVVGEDRQIRECNPILAAAIGSPREEIIGCQISELVDLRFDQGVEPDRILQETASKGNWHGVVDVINRQGREIKADVLIFPVVEPDGTTVFSLIVRDITARYEAETRIAQTQKIEALGRLAGGVAHDINNLLFPIFMNLESALEAVGEHGALQDAYEEIQESMQACTKMKVMLQHILHFSRKNSVDTEEMDVSAVVQEAWGLAKMLVPSSVRKKVEIDENCGTVVANPVQLSQMVLNLVSNAVAAMDGGNGEIHLKLTRTIPTTDQLGKYYKIDRRPVAELVIADTGCGIDKKHIKKIFDPFFTTKEVGQGTGLGLTEVAGIVRTLRGGMDVSSTPGQGTTFRVFLPLKEKALAAE